MTVQHDRRGSAVIWIVVSATIVVVVGALIWLSGKGTPTGSTTLPLDKPAADDWTRGSTSAKAVLIEYSDLQCPACAAYYPIVKQLEEQEQGQLLVVYRHFPLRSIHPNAQPAALAAEAAGKQGKFWEMHDKLFENQSAWSKLNDPLSTFTTYAEEISLNTDQFKTDYAAQDVRDRVNRHADSGRVAGVTGTPTFYLNGTKIKNPPSLEEFKSQVEEAIKNRPVTLSNTNSSEPYHAHADLAVLVDGRQIDFSQAKYQSDEGNELNPFIHFHDGNGQVLHLHKTGMTLGQFFISIKMKLTATCLTTDDNQERCPAGDKKLRWWVNGTEMTVDGSTYVPNDLDRIVFIYGNAAGDSLKKQQDAVSNDACIYSETCPERGKPPTENCVGGLGTDCS